MGKTTKLLVQSRAFIAAPVAYFGSGTSRRDLVFKLVFFSFSLLAIFTEFRAAVTEFRGPVTEF